MSDIFDSPFTDKLSTTDISTSGGKVDHLGVPATYGSVAPIDYMPIPGAQNGTSVFDSPFADKFVDMTTLPINSVDQVRPSGGSPEIQSPFNPVFK